MTEDILAQFMQPKPDYSGLTPEQKEDPEQARGAVPGAAGPGIIPADAPRIEITEEERRQQEVQEYLDSLKPTPTMSAERIEEIRQSVLATVPMANGVPIPESGTLTQEQMRNNPSNYQPAIDPFLAQAAVSSETIVMGVHREEPPVETAPAPKPQEIADERQQWVCVQSDGIRTLDNLGQVHPVFGSNAHLLDNMVACPTCGSLSVRKVMPDESLADSEKAAVWTRERTWRMGLNRAPGSVPG